MRSRDKGSVDSMKHKQEIVSENASNDRDAEVSPYLPYG